MTKSNQKRVALVTGAAGGIGRGICELFLEREWTVIAVDLQESKISHPHLRSIRCDIAEDRAWTEIRTSIEKQEGALHVLIHNAAHQICKSFEETTREDWATIMKSNVEAMFFGTQKMLPLLKNTRESAVVNVGSVHAITTSKGAAAYATSKGGVSALTRVLALELAPYGVRVSAVLPGATDTPMLRAGLSRGHLQGDESGKLAELAGKHPLKRIGTPREIAEAILFLAESSRSAFMTGQEIVVDGGATIHLSTE